MKTSAVTAALAAMQTPISLSHAVDPDGNPFDAPCPDASRAAERVEEWQDLADALERLTDAEWQVVRRRHGLGSDEPMTVREVGRALGVSVRTVHVRELSALAKLKKGLSVQ